MARMVVLNNKKLALEIAKRNYTVIAFSKRCGICRQTVGEIINKKVKCRLLTACKIAKALDLEVEDLLLKEG